MIHLMGMQVLNWKLQFDISIITHDTLSEIQCCRLWLLQTLLSICFIYSILHFYKRYYSYFSSWRNVIYFLFFLLLGLVHCKSKTPLSTLPCAQTQSLCLSNVRMKHSLSSGVKDKPPGLCWAANVSCTLSRVMNILYGLVAEPVKFKNEWTAVQQPI